MMEGLLLSVSEEADEEEEKAEVDDEEFLSIQLVGSQHGQVRAFPSQLASRSLSARGEACEQSAGSKLCEGPADRQKNDDQPMKPGSLQNGPGGAGKCKKHSGGPDLLDLSSSDDETDRGNTSGHGQSAPFVPPARHGRADVVELSSSDSEDEGARWPALNLQPAARASTADAGGAFEGVSPGVRGKSKTTVKARGAEAMQEDAGVAMEGERSIKGAAMKGGRGVEGTGTSGPGSVVWKGTDDEARGMGGVPRQGRTFLKGEEELQQRQGESQPSFAALSSKVRGSGEGEWGAGSGGAVPGEDDPSAWGVLKLRNFLLERKISILGIVEKTELLRKVHHAMAEDRARSSHENPGAGAMDNGGSRVHAGLSPPSEKGVEASQSSPVERSTGCAEIGRKRRWSDEGGEVPGVQGVTSSTERAGSDMELAGKAKRALEAARKQAEKELAKAKREVEQAAKKKQEAEEKARRAEERRRKAEDKKSEREALKQGKAAEREAARKSGGKDALKDITAYVDQRIMASDNVGAELIMAFQEKHYRFETVQNPIAHSIRWRRTVYRHMARIEDGESQQMESQCSQVGGGENEAGELEDVPYLMMVLSAVDFCSLVVAGQLPDHIAHMAQVHPGWAVCYVVPGLHRHMKKKEQVVYAARGAGRTAASVQYQAPVEAALADLCVSYDAVRSRICVDAAQAAEHVVMVHRAHAEAPYRKELSYLSTFGAGNHIKAAHRGRLRNETWSRVLTCLPRVSPADAEAIAEAYPNMRSLLEAYANTRLTEQQKAALLKDLTKFSRIGEGANPMQESRRHVGQAVSTKVYRFFCSSSPDMAIEELG